MRYFVPNLKLSGDLPPQDKLEDKLGGLPWGLKPEQYPVCSHCGNHQSLLVQFVHHPERLNLGAPGRVLFVFHCNHDPGTCPTWEGGAGANACFVLDTDELTEGLTLVPLDSSLIETEARITDWLIREDGISVDEIPAFYDDEQHWNLSWEMKDRVYASTKLGSVPDWIQDPSHGPGEGWVFIGQLSDGYSFSEAPSVQRDVEVHYTRNDWGKHTPRYYLGQDGVDVYSSWNKWGEQEWYCDGPNFGDAGNGYIFLRYHQHEKPEGWFIFQCS